MAAPAPQPPDLRQRTLASALGNEHTLRDLLARVRESQRRLDTIAPLMEPPLRAAVQAGPLDDSAWVLLASHSSAAAKLRQLAPVFAAALLKAGLEGPPIKVKVSSAININTQANTQAASTLASPGRPRRW